VALPLLLNFSSNLPFKQKQSVCPKRLAMPSGYAQLQHYCLAFGRYWVQTVGGPPVVLASIVVINYLFV
jgi:hypothetical protein